jgi:putative endonuclease
MGQYFVYMLASGPRGTLYVGVTNDLLRRVSQHKKGTGSKFAARYKVDQLVYYSAFTSVYEAIRYEKRIKNWRREWKLNHIEDVNAEWRDLYYDFVDYDADSG